MNAMRTERVTVNLTPELLDRLDRFAQMRRWSLSAAIEYFIEHGLDEVPFR